MTQNDLVGRILSEAAIADRPGSLKRLESIAAEVRELQAECELWERSALDEAAISGETELELVQTLDVLAKVREWSGRMKKLYADEIDYGELDNILASALESDD